ncbi:TerB family tellurite resistance protein [Aquimarina sp. SS2-1]|uniref:TerB family tellurite resistance protein n=1 Tax=Aquimarina besae TaxID=3342247 RepID=UPI00366B562A
MSISKIYQSENQKSNIIHFAAIFNIASIDGALNDEEKKMLSKFANKLNIGEEEYEQIIKKSDTYPVAFVSSKEERLQHIFDLFRMIYADHEIDEPESKLLYKYAIGLGCSETKAKEVIQKSIKIFSGNIDFEDYQYLIEKD